MSDIQVGDLVYVFRDTICCNHVTEMSGVIFRLTAISPCSGDCCYCGASLHPMKAVGGRYTLDVRRLKRIPPLSELEGERTEEKLKEPA